jgi:hypothetical protein
MQVSNGCVKNTAQNERNVSGILKIVEKTRVIMPEIENECGWHI